MNAFMLQYIKPRRRFSRIDTNPYLHLPYMCNPGEDPGSGVARITGTDRNGMPDRNGLLKNRKTETESKLLAIYE